MGLWLKFPGSSELLAYGPLVFLLLVLAFLDLECWWLPNIFTYAGIVLGLILAPAFGHISIFEAAAGAVSGWLFLESIRRGYKLIHRQRWHGGRGRQVAGLDWGISGNSSLPWICLISAGLGLIAGTILAWRNRSGLLTPIPYGPFLILAAIIVLFQGNYFF